MRGFKMQAQRRDVSLQLKIPVTALPRQAAFVRDRRGVFEPRVLVQA